MLDIVLRSEGFQARLCHVGDAALEAFREYRPDLVVVMNPVYVEEIQRDLDRLGLTPELVSV